MQDVAEFPDLFSFMRGGKGDSQSRLATRHGWVANRRNENILPEQIRGHFDGLCFVADD